MHTYIALNLGNDSCPIFVNDGINLLNDIKVGLIVGVLDASPSPGNVGELASGQSGPHTATNSGYKV